MEYIEMIKNSFNYALSDNNKLLKLMIPNIVVGVFLGIASIAYFSVFSSSHYYYSNDPMIMVGGICMIIAVILGIIAAILDYGIMVGVMKNSIRGYHELPEFEIGTFFVDGLKLIVVNFLYALVPAIIYFVLLMIGISARSVVLTVIGVIVFIILMIIVYLLMPVACGKLAETDSIGAALSIGDVWEISGRIGIVDIFVMLLLAGVITGLISGIAQLLTFIPFIGPVIVVLVALLILIFMARIYALIYLEQYNTNPNINRNYQQPNNQMNYQQNYQQQNNPFNNPQQNNGPNYPQNSQPGYPQNGQNPPQNNQMDFQPNNQPTQNMKICPACGQQNPGMANQCMNCGNYLQ